MAYKYAIEKKVEEITGKKKYAQTYLSFSNIAIIPHHGKATALLLIELCKHLKLDYFVINDRDFENEFIVQLYAFDNENDLKMSDMYLFDIGNDKTEKSKLTINWKLLKNAGIDKIHFNIKKLEEVLNCSFSNKSSIKLWEHLNDVEQFTKDFFPFQLEQFLKLIL